MVEGGLGLPPSGGLTMSDIRLELDGLRARLNSLSITDIRGQAAKVYGLRITREMTKDEITELIIGHVAKTNVAHAADGELKPGWSRIKLNNTGDYRSEQPVYVNANGFECHVPFGIEVDVPTRCLESLKNAVEYRVYVNDFQEKAHKFSDSYPFNVIAQREGPDPRPGLEVRREAKLAPKRRFLKKWKFFPTDKQFREFVQSGMFKLDEQDFVVAEPKSE